jgi:Flp pilus assembly protein TadG
MTMGRFSLLGGLRGKDRRGTSALEFAIIAPVLFLVVFGEAEFGIVLSEYFTLANAVGSGAMQFAFSAGVDATPYTDAVSAITTAAPTLTPLTITLSVNGTPCTTDVACAPALSAGTGYVTAKATYPCASSQVVYDLMPGCTLMAQQTERVQ